MNRRSFLGSPLGRYRVNGLPHAIFLNPCEWKIGQMRRKAVFPLIGQQKKVTKCVD